MGFQILIIKINIICLEEHLSTMACQELQVSLAFQEEEFHLIQLAILEENLVRQHLFTVKDRIKSQHKVGKISYLKGM
jgi:hypothetical protein